MSKNQQPNPATQAQQVIAGNQPHPSPTPAEQPLTFAEANGASFSDDMIAAFKDLPQFYKSTLYLKEIQKPENEELYNKLIAKHVDKSLVDDEDDFGNDKFVKSLVKYNMIEDDDEFASIRKTVDENLAKIRDSHIRKNLESAGFTQDEISKFDKDSIDSLKVQKLFFNEMVFEHDGKGRASIAQGREFIDALKVNKDAIMGFLANKNTQYAMNAIGLALAVSSGGTVPLIMQGIKFTGMAMQNDVVKGIFKKFTDKIGAEFTKRGIDITPAKEVAEKAGGFLAGLKNSRFVKAAMFVSVIAGGAAVADLVTGGQVSDFTGEMLGDAFNEIGLTDNLEIPTENVEAPSVKAEIPTENIEVSPEKAEIQTENVEASSEKAEIPTENVEASSEKAAVTTENVEASSEKAAVTTETVTPQVNDYVVQGGDKAMTIAKQAYFDATGSYPTEQQIVAIVNDFGLKDPNSIMPGQVLAVPTNFDKYALDSLGKVQADWLTEPQSAITAKVEASVATAEPSVSTTEPYAATAVADLSCDNIANIQSYYNIDMINQLHGANHNIEAIQKMNAGLDVSNLSPGDQVNLGDVVYTVPNVNDAIINSIFGSEGAPNFINTDAFVDMVKDANTDKDLSEGLLGFQYLGGNSDIGSLLAKDGLINVPAVDYNALNPAVLETNVSGVNHNNINIHILNAAYPDGVPELLDTKAFLNVVKDMNPGLENLQNKDYFSTNVTFPTMDQIQAHINGVDSPNIEVSQQTPSEALQINKEISVDDIKKKAIEMAGKKVDAGYTM